MTTRRRLVRVPASSANLGPGYDAMAAAVSLHLELEVEETGEYSFDPGGLEVPTGRDNLIVRAFESLRPADGIAFRLRSEIPLTRGLGTSFAEVAADLSDQVIPRPFCASFSPAFQSPMNLPSLGIFTVARFACSIALARACGSGLPCAFEHSAFDASCCSRSIFAMP